MSHGAEHATIADVIGIFPGAAGTIGVTQLVVASTPVPEGAQILFDSDPLTSVHAPRTSGQDDFRGDLNTEISVATEISQAINDRNNSFSTRIFARTLESIVSLIPLTADTIQLDLVDADGSLVLSSSSVPGISPLMLNIMEIVREMVDPCVWGGKTKKAEEFLAAHLLSLMLGPDGGGSSGTDVTGPVLSRKLDTIAETFAGTSTSERTSDATLDRTSFGQAYLLLRGTVSTIGITGRSSVCPPLVGFP